MFRENELDVRPGERRQFEDPGSQKHPLSEEAHLARTGDDISRDVECRKERTSRKKMFAGLEEGGAPGVEEGFPGRILDPADLARSEPPLGISHRIVFVEFTSEQTKLRFESAAQLEIYEHGAARVEDSIDAWPWASALPTLENDRDGLRVVATQHRRDLRFLESLRTERLREDPPRARFIDAEPTCDARFGDPTALRIASTLDARNQFGIDTPKQRTAPR